jgi:adenosyl cobinamide kinase/adenosyl cobinamide phosphate guanylyltransferase
MPLTLLLGGARSGKSSLAVRMAASNGSPVVFIATAEPRDEEMRARILEHRAQRPPGWELVEEPVALEEALVDLPPETCAVVDCLTLWVANLVEHGSSDQEIRDRASAAAALASGRMGRTIAVTNEVGSGIVPVNPLARRYRDLLGSVNALWAEAADTALLVIAGRVLILAEVPAPRQVPADG